MANSISRKRFITGIGAIAIGAIGTIALKPNQALADVLTLADVLATATAQTQTTPTPTPTPTTYIPRYDDSMLKPTLEPFVAKTPTWNWVYPNSDVLTLNCYDANRIMFSHESLRVKWYADYHLIKSFDIPVGPYPRRYFTVPFLPTSANQFILFTDHTGRVGCWWSK